VSERGHPHDSYESTRKINYDRCRREGIPPDAARKIADEAARRSHDQLDKKG
jgi:hypothetical protein